MYLFNLHNDIAVDGEGFLSRRVFVCHIGSCVVAACGKFSGQLDTELSFAIRRRHMLQNGFTGFRCVCDGILIFGIKNAVSGHFIAIPIVDGGKGIAAVRSIRDKGSGNDRSAWCNCLFFREGRAYRGVTTDWYD